MIAFVSYLLIDRSAGVVDELYSALGAGKPGKAEAMPH